MRTLAILVLLLAPGHHAFAQLDGHVSLMYDVVPDVDAAPGTQDVHELRTRLFAERRQEIGERLRVVVGAYVDGLVAHREAVGAQGTTADAVVRPGDVYAEFTGAAFDVRVGYSRIVWGRLDEFLPTDVVNPIDLTRFLLEGRSEARLPVALVRGRVFLPRSSTLEALVVPAFRAGRFDQLDERTSPFNLLRAPFPSERRQPAVSWRNVQGGARFTSTSGRVDWGVSGYRGFRSFPTVRLVPTPPTFMLVEVFPRFTMVGADFETVRGSWGLRGEAATFVERGEHTFEGGIGVDRRAGDYRLAGNALWSSEEGASVVMAADRSFARDTRTLRVFTAYDPGDRTAFGRVVAAFLMREHTWLEGSAGVFGGTSSDTLGRLTNRDFAYVRLKVFF